MRILVAMDVSECSETAARAVATRPWPARTTVRVVSVVRRLAFPPPPPPPWSPNSARSAKDVGSLALRASWLVQRTAEALGQRGLHADWLVLRGDPAAEILREARRWRADLIVVGTHGRTGIKRWILGSVAQEVVRRASCSVEVVRRTEPEQAAIAASAASVEARWAHHLADGGPPP